MDSNFTNENDPWEYSLDIDDSDLHLTPVLVRSSAHVEPSPYTPKSSYHNTGPAGVVPLSYSIRFRETLTTFIKRGKLEQLLPIVKSCSPNALGDLNVTLKDLSGTVPGTIHYKVLDVGSYEKDITVGAAMILVNVSVFTPKPSKHYLNITKRNVVEVFRKDTVSLA
ncbi:transposase, MuDR, MULE transposase domain protein [Tanacetum coccineum]|uniref:Transposase, MuDR, MULE transposase domain protein n=1 Tax=Tanacetum coccineum TaxID=301880 RepID=A0ABQ4WG26_9ASTR